MSEWTVASPKHLEQRVGRSEYRQVSQIGSFSPGELATIVEALNGVLRARNADLLAALEKLMPMLDAKQKYDKSLTEVGHAAINAARAAIAQAK